MNLSICMGAIILFALAFAPTADKGLAADVSITGTLESYSTFTVTDSAIAFGTNLELSSPVDTATISSETRVIFDSENDATTASDSASFHESTTNDNASFYLTVSGTTHSYSGTSSTSWIYFKDSSNTHDPDGSATNYGSYGSYWPVSISGTLADASSITPPSGKTSDIGVNVSMTFLGSNDSSSDLWAAITSTITILVTTDDYVYIDDDYNFTDTTEGGVISEVGPLTAQYDNASIFGNRFVLINDPSALSATDTITFRFGWYVAYDGTPDDDAMTFYVLIAPPQYAPAIALTWDVTINHAVHA